MSGKNKLETTATWVIRIVLLPIGLFFLWAGLNQLLVSEPTSTLGGGAQSLVLAGFTLYAAIYPAPPWRNEPLKTVLVALICMAAVALWWFAIVIGAFVAAKHTVGEDSNFFRALVLLLIVGLLALQFFLTVVVQKWFQKRRSSAANDDASPST